MVFPANYYAATKKGTELMAHTVEQGVRHFVDWYLDYYKVKR